MWNNGNQGNGQGNGYPQQQGYPQQNQPQAQSYGPQDTYDRLNNARQITNRDPYIEEGKHRLVVESLEEFAHETGPAVRGTFEVLASTRHPVGSKVATVWFLMKPAFKPGMTTDSDRFADFCTRLKGAPVGYPIGNDIRVLLKERAKEQLARGMVIDVEGVRKFAKTLTEKNKDGFVVSQWSNVAQSPQDIASQRARLDAKAQSAPAAQPPMYAQPAMTQYAQPTAAPTPQGPPPGGYLANVPTNNGGGQGGNGSW